MIGTCPTKRQQMATGFENPQALRSPRLTPLLETLTLNPPSSHLVGSTRWVMVTANVIPCVPPVSHTLHESLTWRIPFLTHEA
jgi:hypothetical protein